MPFFAGTTYDLFDHVINVTLFKWEKYTDDDLEDWQGPQYVQRTLPNGEVIQSLRTYAKVQMDENGNTQYKYFKPGRKPKVDLNSRIIIECPEGGIKPGISVKFSLVGGEYCYQVIVDIINLHIDINVRDLDEMEIELGYRGGAMRKLNCDIMTAYTLSPGPDSVTRFQCMAVGNINLLTHDHPITLLFGSREATVAEIVTQGASALHDIGYPELKEPPFAVTAKFACSTETLNTKLSVPRRATYRNGAQVMKWLTKTLAEINLFVFISQSELICMSNQLTQEEVELLESTAGMSRLRSKALESANERSGGSTVVYTLDRVTSASIVGGLVNVIAPFVPQLRPSDIFKMEPNYFDGSSFLSERFIPMSLVIGGSDGRRYGVYRIIKMEVEFGTNNGANKMEILAVPIAAKDIDAKTGMTLSQKAQVDNNKTGLTTQDTKMTENVVQEDKGEWYIGLKTIQMNATDYLVDTSTHPWDDQGLNVIAKVVWSKKWGNDDMAALYRKEGAANFKNLLNKELTVQNWKNPDGDDPPYMDTGSRRPVYDSTNMWPLICAATYLAMIEDRKNGGKVGYNVDVENPDRLGERWMLRIPQLNSNSDVDKYKDWADMFIRMGKFKRDVQKDAAVGEALLNIGHYLGGDANG